jgi:acetyl esterase/lipase
MRVSVKPALKTATLEDCRQTIGLYLDRYMPKPPRELEITPVDEGDFKGERIRNRQDAGSRAVLYLHGGAFLTGSPLTHRGITCGLAMEKLGTIWALDYPLAPEHGIDEMLDAVVRAYRHILDGGTAPENMLLAGDQSGAWLATRLLLRLRDEGGELPAAAALICPFLDPSLSGDSFVANREEDPLSDHGATMRALEMVFQGRDRNAAENCLLKADLGNLPPILLQTSDIDLLRDDATRMASVLDAEGSVARLEIWKGVPAVWHLFWWKLPEARSATRAAARFLLERSGSGSQSTLPD